MLGAPSATYTAANVLLTRIWAVILACLATFFLAGMFMVAAGSGGGFTDADKAAVGAITQAGIAALEAEIAASPVKRAAGLIDDPRIQDVLGRSDDAVEPGQQTLGELVEEITEDYRVQSNTRTLTTAVLDEDFDLKAANGEAVPDLSELLTSEAFNAAKEQSSTFSITLDGDLHVAHLSRADYAGNRVVALAELNVGADSLLRRVLGSKSPAGLVRGGKLVGDIIGDQPVQDELIMLASTHIGDAPAQGASTVFVVGEGQDARLGALGRLPGPAGRGDAGTVFTVLSGETAAASQRDLAETLRVARNENPLGGAQWGLLLGLLVVTAGLAVYLPGIEASAPMRRLSKELNAMAQGAQHSIFHDRYSGIAGELARSANSAHEALRQAYLAELEIDEEEIEENPTAPRARPTTRGRRLNVSRSNRRVPDTGSRGRSRRTPSRPSPPTATKTDAPSSEAETEQAETPAVAQPAATPTPVATPAEPTKKRAPMPTTMGGPAPPPITAPRATAPPAEPSSTPTPVSTPVPNPAPDVPPDFDPPTLEPASFEPPSFDPPPTDPPAAEGIDPREAYYREVYDEFLQVKQACGENTANFTFDKFSAKLAKNTADIRKKREGVKDVRFTVYVKDGKAALKAKVVK